MHTHWVEPDRAEKSRYWGNPCNTLDPVAVGLFEGCRCVLALDLLAPGLSLVAVLESTDRRQRARFAARYSTDSEGRIIPDVLACMLFGGPGHLPDDLHNPFRSRLKHHLRVESLATGVLAAGKGRSGI